MAEEVKLPQGYRCKCKRFNEFSLWVFAHWSDAVIHICECGRKHLVYRGEATFIKPRSEEDPRHDPRRQARRKR